MKLELLPYIQGYLLVNSYYLTGFPFVNLQLVSYRDTYCESSAATLHTWIPFCESSADTLQGYRLFVNLRLIGTLQGYFL